MKWIRDEEFIRGSIPMTKFNVRALIMVYMDIKDGDRFLDIGAGTGSISIEAALQGAYVTSIEKNKEAIDLIKKNMEKFNVNLNLIEGVAPKELLNKKYNKVFIGGNEGKLYEIFEYLENSLEYKGILCGNFIMIKNLNLFLELLEKFNYSKVETHMVQCSYMNKIGLMKGENPIYIVKGVKL